MRAESPIGAGGNVAVPIWVVEGETEEWESIPHGECSSDQTGRFLQRENMAREEKSRAGTVETVPENG